MIALPVLPDAIPAHLTVRQDLAYLQALARALIQAGLLELPATPPAAAMVDESTLIQAGLKGWWDRITQPLKLFRLHLLAEQTLRFDPDEAGASGDPHPAGKVWMCLFHDGNRPEDLQLRRRITELEKECPGLGQTALALLYDALRNLPLTIWPQRALWVACDHYWWGEQDERYRVEELAEQEDAEKFDLKTPAGLADAAEYFGLMSRRLFDSHIPPWVSHPQRVRSRDSAKRMVRSNHARKVLAALDAVSAAAHAKPLRRHGFHTLECMAMGWGMYVWWHENDLTGQVMDDAGEEAAQVGEYHEYLWAEAVPLEPKALADWKAGMENMIKLAVATEELLLLIGERI